MVTALNPLSSTSLLASLGTLGVFLVMFAETGLLIGFFLPGDSLLFTAGLLCTGTVSHAAHLSLPLVILAAAGGALLGAQTGFYIGRAGGRPLLQRTRNPYLRTGAERARAAAGPVRLRQGHRAGPVHPGGPHRAQPAGRGTGRAGPHVHHLAGGRRPGLVGRGHPGRLHAGLGHPRHRHLPAARDRRHRAALADPDRPGGLPHPVRDPPRRDGRRRRQDGDRPAQCRPSWPGEQRPGAAAGHVRVSRGELPASPPRIPR